MRRFIGVFIMLGFAAGMASCKKEQAVVARVAAATPTPVPDKDLLGFTRSGAIWAMRYDGTEQHLLARANKGQSFWFPVPAPTNDHLIAWMSRPDGTQDIVRIDLSGRVTVLTEIGAPAKSLMKNVRLGNAPAYSPDGKRIAYSFNGNLWMMDASGYNAETFIADGASWCPSFSPDGKRLAYVNGTSNHFDIWMADIESRDTWQVSSYADYTVGQPRWNKDSSGIIFTRSQGEDSDVVLVNLPKDMSKGTESSAPISEGEPLTKDHLSGAAVWDPTGMHILFSSARENGLAWNLYSADSLGGNSKQLTHEGAYSPFWMRPSSLAASVLDLGPSRPTPVAAMAAEKVATLPPAAPTHVVALTPPVSMAPKPMATVAAVTAAVVGAPPKNANPTPAPTHAQANPGPVATAPSKTQAPAPSKPTVLAAAAPTQPPAKAAPLRLRLRASFSDEGQLAPSGLTELKKLAPRVAQYAGETVTIIGPLDRGPLKGKFSSEELRSLVRAKAIVTELSKQAKLGPGVAKAQPYAPPVAGASGPPNSIQVYVELK